MTESATMRDTDPHILGTRLEEAWARSDRIFDLLAPAAFYERPIALRQPFLFYVGHLPAFAWNQVVGGLLGRTGPQPELDRLFARGIDPVDVDRYQPDRPDAWPSMTETLAYRDRVRDTLRSSLDAVASLADRDELAARGRVLNLVIEHEVMHHETLLYMVQQLDRGLRKSKVEPSYPLDGAIPAARRSVPGGRVALGADFDAVPFGWDNEFPATDADVDGFAIDATPVRNAEWRAFMDDGGYDRSALWTPDGWAWKERVGHRHPVFWRKAPDGWRYEALDASLALETVADWPVYVSWAEADAYARWRGGSLPTEAEFHRAAEGIHWGDPRVGNYDFRLWSPEPVGRTAAGASDHGVYDLVGNGWEWTRSVFAPFHGFRAWARTYPGYSADFFDERHYVMLGASWATDRCLVRRSFRNWFQPHYPFMFAKFRCVYR